MGREYNAQILRQYQIYEDEKIQNYVQSIGESLAKKSHRPNLIYRFTVLDDRSDHNLNKIIKMGEMWWDKFGEEAYSIKRDRNRTADKFCSTYGRLSAAITSLK